MYNFLQEKSVASTFIDGDFSVNSSYYLNKDNFTRLDIEMVKFGYDMSVYPSLLDANKISNPFDLKPGRFMIMPDFSLLENQIRTIDLVGLQSIPGVNSKPPQNTNTKNRKVSLTKIDKIFDNVSYDENTGTIKY